MKKLGLLGLLLLSVIFLNSCASQSEVSSTTPSGGTVPGEQKSTDDIVAGAGPGTANAGVKW